ncbi:hypothetical protein JG687_00018465 [Phytophthora cactorum]|uniref:Uncharacterized protein n=1 Tax=Phytophthora cactorum TaxID=29920 RepID=A0A8T1TPR2_9STRA|nr:hypothetical protein JG687_00018465 [Phytophthora cactorum]
MVKTEELHGDEKLFSKAVDQFPSIFKSKTRRSNVGKAGDWWRKRVQFVEAPRGSTVLSGCRSHGRVRVNRKAIVGRGRRTSPWVIWLYLILRAEFDRLRKARLKYDAPLLRQVALRQFQAPGATFTEASVDCNGVPLATKVTSRLDKNAVENIDETHFMIDFDNGKTLGFVGEKKVKYDDVVSGGEGMKMVVRIYGGPSRYIHPPMMIFTNANRSYPIRGVEDNVRGACYRTVRKGWMNQRIFRSTLPKGGQWLPIRRAAERQSFWTTVRGI